MADEPMSQNKPNNSKNNQPDDFSADEFEPTEPIERPLSDTELHAQDVPLNENDDLTLTGIFEEIEDEKKYHLNVEEGVDPDAHTLPMQQDDDDTEDIEIPSEEEIIAAHRKRRYDQYQSIYGEQTEESSADDESDADFDLIDKMLGNRDYSPNDPTLAGSGGLDPNPDFIENSPEQTVVNPVANRSQTRFQRPEATVPSQSQYAPPPMQQQQQPMPPPMRRPQASSRRSARKFNIGCFAIFLGLVITLCGGLTVISLFGGMFAYARVGDLVNQRIDELEEYDAFQSTFMVDRNGRELFEFFDEGRRTSVSLSEIPQDLINATIATEDDEFWTNIGIDIGATSLAVFQYLGAPADDTAGGSTITQQLVRNVLFDYEYRNERSVTRKVEEILLAVALTGRMTKEEILELYLNEIYYGNLAYGVGAAAQIFFGKDVSELTLGESALLAGLPQAPASLDPLNPDPTIQQAVEQRWKLVLDLMVEEGYITTQQRDDALREGYSLSSPDIYLRAPHFTVYAQRQLEILLTNLGYGPEEITQGGLRVYTTVDLNINDSAQAGVRDQIDKLRVSNNVGNGAVVVLKPVTGEIIAMVGSADYDNDAIDGRVNVTTALRQPGSTMKPLTYAAATELGMTPGDVIWDTPTRIGLPGQPAYEPVNYDRRFHGPMRMREALANSYNVPAVQTLRHNVTVPYFLDFLRRFGITTLSQDASVYGLSLTLGGGEVSLLELTNSYAVFSNDGLLVEPQAILCILNSDKEIVYQFENSCSEGQETSQTVNDYANPKRVLDERISFLISDILSDNNARTPAMGSNSQLYTPGIQSSVKTGTTNDNKDNWTIGYTKNVAIGVWVGNNNGDPMIGTSGLSGAAPIWNSLIRTIYNSSDMLATMSHNGQLLNDQLQPSQGVSQRQMCRLSSMIDPVTSCPSFETEWFLDYPAGIPNAEGFLDYPPAPQQEPVQPPTTGSYVIPDSPGVYRSIVHPVSPEIAASIQLPIGASGVRPPAPAYCRVPVEMIPTTQGISEQLFIAPPPDADDAAQAEHFARQRGLAFLPSIDCNSTLVSGGSSLPIIIPASISSPVPGQSVPPEGLPIIGTIQFNPGQIDFYRFLIRSTSGGNFPDWTTIGNIHRESIINGQLEFLPGYPGLQSGNYELKMEIIGNDSALFQAPIVVPFRIE